MEHGKRVEDFRPSPWPEDFSQGLERLTELAGLSWEELAERLDIEDDRVREWRTGTIPTGGEVSHIMRLALSVPGRFNALSPHWRGPKTTKMDKKHGSRQESHPLLDRPEIDWPCRTRISCHHLVLTAH